MTIKQYLEVGFDVAVVYVAYRFFGWIGFGVSVFFVISVFAIQMITAQKTGVLPPKSLVQNAVCTLKILRSSL
jgi:hypothetical protein